MLSINFTRPLATLAVIAGLLAVAGPASGSAAKPSAAGGIVTNNKDPDKLSVEHASEPSGALVAADFDYKEATGSTAPRGSTKGSFIDGGVVGFFDIPAELLRTAVEDSAGR